VTSISIGGGIVSPDHRHLIILDGHCSHVSLDIVQEARGIGIDMLTLPSHIGMSKWTTYGKIYRPDVRFIQMSAFVVRTSALIPRMRFYPRTGFYRSVPTIKTCPHGHGMDPYGRGSPWARIRTDVARPRRSARVCGCGKDTRHADTSPCERGATSVRTWF
jgi:hypothetical protein